MLTNPERVKSERLSYFEDQPPHMAIRLDSGRTILIEFSRKNDRVKLFESLRDSTFERCTVADTGLEANELIRLIEKGRCWLPSLGAQTPVRGSEALACWIRHRFAAYTYYICLEPELKT